MAPRWSTGSRLGARLKWPGFSRRGAMDRRHLSIGSPAVPAQMAAIRNRQPVSLAGRTVLLEISATACFLSGSRLRAICFAVDPVSAEEQLSPAVARAREDGTGNNSGCERGYLILACRAPRLSHVRSNWFRVCRNHILIQGSRRNVSVNCDVVLP